MPQKQGLVLSVVVGGVQPSQRFPLLISQLVTLQQLLDVLAVLSSKDAILRLRLIVSEVTQTFLLLVA